MLFKAKLVRTRKDELKIFIYESPRPNMNVITEEVLYNNGFFKIRVADTVEIRTNASEPSLFLPGRSDFAYPPHIGSICNTPESIDRWIELYKVAHKAVNGFEAVILDLRQWDGDVFPMETVG